MAQVEVRSDELVVTPTALERLSGLLKPLTVPLHSIESARVVEDGYATARGVRAPGLSVPGRVKIGTWRRNGERSYVIGRRRPALVLTLRGQALSTVVVDVPAGADAEAIVQRLSSR